MEERRIALSDEAATCVRSRARVPRRVAAGRVNLPRTTPPHICSSSSSLHPPFHTWSLAVLASHSRSFARTKKSVRQGIVDPDQPSQGRGIPAREDCDEQDACSAHNDMVQDA